MPQAHNDSAPLYIRVAQLRARYGDVSDMWITRRTRDDEFPAPVYFGTAERFWKIDQLDAWDRLMIERGCKANKRSLPPSRRKAALA